MRNAFVRLIAVCLEGFNFLKELSTLGVKGDQAVNILGLDAFFLEPLFLFSVGLLGYLALWKRMKLYLPLALPLLVWALTGS